MRDVRSLMWDYSLPEVLKMKEWVDTMTALETAQGYDHQREENSK